jgi:hypothetical protein
MRNTVHPSGSQLLARRLQAQVNEKKTGELVEVISEPSEVERS